MEEKNIAILEEHNAGKMPYKEAEVAVLLGKCEKVVVTSGKKILEFAPDAGEEMMGKIMGRSGNLRAPSLLIGTTLYVGYNEDLYDERITV